MTAAANEYYILYNPLAGNGKGKEMAQILKGVLSGAVTLIDITRITNYKAFLSDKSQATLVICGGDGTLNRFINDTASLELHNEILYYGAGTGNDFLRDLGIREQNGPVRINEYIQALPMCEVNGRKLRFLNNVGFGIDGYCCDVADELRRRSQKPVHYTAIALRGLLFHYRPTNATVTVDGEQHRYKNVWFAPTMNGRFYGGGIMPTPDQDRRNPRHTVSLFLYHGSGKLRALLRLPILFAGPRWKRTKVADILEGREITVTFDSPKAVQIDGETVRNVTQYRVYAYGTAQNSTSSVKAAACFS